MASIKLHSVTFKHPVPLHTSDLNADQKVKLSEFLRFLMVQNGCYLQRVGDQNERHIYPKIANRWRAFYA